MAEENRTLWFSKVSSRRYFLWLGVLLAVLFAALEPAGAAGLGFGRGLLFWLTQMVVAIPLLIVCQKFVVRTLSVTNRPWVATLVAGCLGAVLFSIPAYYLDVLLEIPEDNPQASAVFGILDEIAGTFVPVVVVWLAMNAPWILELDFRPAVSEERPASSNDKLESPKRSEFLELVNSVGIEKLIAISSELHYIRVFTEAGESLLLYNLRDAIALLPESLGTMVHRSHWVSVTHFKSLETTQGQLFCLMKNGLSFPVSRRRKIEVKEFFSAK